MQCKQDAGKNGADEPSHRGRAANRADTLVHVHIGHGHGYPESGGIGMLEHQGACSTGQEGCDWGNAQGCQHWLYQRCRRHDPKGIGAGYHMDDGRDDDGNQDGREGVLHDDVRNLLSNACVLYKGCQGAAHTGNNNWHCSCNDSFIYPVV